MRAGRCRVGKRRKLEGKGSQSVNQNFSFPTLTQSKKVVGYATYALFPVVAITESSKYVRYVSNVVRQNTTNLIVGSPFPNKKELLKIAEEFGDVVGGQENWLRIYHTACQERYDFLHMDMQSNPVKCYRNFTTLISEGEHLLGGGTEPRPRSCQRAGAEPEPEPGHK